MRPSVLSSVVVAACLSAYLAEASMGREVWVVNQEGTGDFRTIQDGIDASSNGDTVLVADGTYIGAGNKCLDFGGKAITLRSKNGPSKCIIDGEGRGRGVYFHRGERRDSVLDGFTITGCDRSGILVEGCDPLIDHCRIMGNTVEDPDSPDGAGVHVTGHGTWHASPLIRNCIIQFNSGARNGGGIYIYECSPIVLNCSISFNKAATGAGVGVYTGNPILTNCTIAANSSSKSGGGVHMDHYWGKKGASVSNSVVWGNSPNNVTVKRGSVVVSYCDIGGGWAGDGNLDVDPLFVNARSDLRLGRRSPCIDAGDNDASEVASLDIDGRPRILDGDGDREAIVDMGASEFAGRRK